MSCTKNMGKNIGKNISKILIGKYSQIFIDHAKECATDALKTTSKRTIQKTAEATADLVGKKIANRIKIFKRNSQQNHSERVTNEPDKEISKERYL